MTQERETEGERKQLERERKKGERETERHKKDRERREIEREKHLNYIKQQKWQALRKFKNWDLNENERQSKSVLKGSYKNGHNVF